jgi:uncharacterized protein
MSITNRRQFMGLAGAAGVALPSLLRRAGAAEVAGAPPTGHPATEPRVLVDWHSHFVSETEVRALSARHTVPRIITAADGSTRVENPTTVSTPAGRPSDYSPSDIEARIRHLDEHGIARQLLSHTVALGLDATLPLSELRPLFRAFNDELARVIRGHPTRFLAVAALPSADPQWAADELKRAQHELGFIGGSLPLNAFATLEGARTLAPLFNTAQGLRSHFFVHRGPANAAVPGQPPLIVPSDNDSLRWSLINNTHLTAGGITLGLTDFLDPYPDVSVEIVMLAGFLPYLTDTWIQAANSSGIPNPLQRLRRLYVDPGPYSRNGEWVRLTAEKLGADRILFGTDYGVGGGSRGDVGPAIATLDKSLTELERQLIYVDNSRQLLRAKGFV